MKQRFHQPHFAKAIKTIRERKAPWLFAPVIALIGSATALDFVFGIWASIWKSYVLEPTRDEYNGLFHVFLNAPLSSQATLIVSIILIIIIVLIVQGATIYSMYANHHVQLHHALAHGARRLMATAGIVIVTLALTVLIFSTSAHVLSSLEGYQPLWNAVLRISLFTIMGAALLAVLSIRFLALNLAIGAKKSAIDAIGEAFEFVRRYPILLLEHNAILVGVYIFCFVIFILFSFFVALPFIVPLLSIVIIPTWPPIISALPIALLALVGWFALGLITLYNYAAWAELTHRLLRAPSVTSRFVHTARTYIPLLR